MHLIKVNIIGLESFETSFNGSLDMEAVNGGEPMTDRRDEPAACCSCYFGCQYDGITRLGLHPLTHDLFRDACQFALGRYRIELGSVKKIDTVIKGFVHDSKRLFFVTLRSKCHRPHTDGRNPQACSSYVAVLHQVSLHFF